MSEFPLIRDGKIILRLVDHEDGTVTLKKPMPVKEQHIYQQTGAPGWDKRLVDQAFLDRTGTLEYVDGVSKFSIAHDVFIRHAYVSKHAIFGEQYHCEKQWYEEQLLVITEPVRGGGTIQGNVYVEPPTKMEFGTTLRCKKCRGSGIKPGMRKAGSCDECMGIGYTPWRPPRVRSTK